MVCSTVLTLAGLWSLTIVISAHKWKGHSMFPALARLLLRRARAVLIAGLLLALISGVYGLGVFQNLKGGGFYNPDAESSKVRAIMHEQLGQNTEALLIF